LAKHQKLGVDKSEGIDNDFTLDGLNGIDDDSNGTGVQLLK